MRSIWKKMKAGEGQCFISSKDNRSSYRPPVNTCDGDDDFGAPDLSEGDN